MEGIDDPPRPEARIVPEGRRLVLFRVLLSDEECLERLSGKSNRTIASYAAGARNKFEGRPSPIDAAVTAITLAGQTARRHWIAAVTNVPDLDELVADVQEAGPPAKSFLQRPDQG